jgi:hypothetical protein
MTYIFEHAEFRGLYGAVPGAHVHAQDGFEMAIPCSRQHRAVAYID